MGGGTESTHPIPIPWHTDRFHFLLACLYLTFSKLKKKHGTKEMRAKPEFFIEPENCVLLSFRIPGHLDIPVRPLYSSNVASQQSTELGQLAQCWASPTDRWKER